MGFWPTGPITLTFTVIIFTVSVGFLIWGDRSQRFIALAFLASWIGARTATVTENQWIYVAFLTLSAGLSLAGITLISRAIATIYGLRLCLVAGMQWGLWEWYLLWELNFVFLALQIILALGSVGGGSHRMAGSVGNNRGINRFGAVALRRVLQLPFKRNP